MSALSPRPLPPSGHPARSLSRMGHDAFYTLVVYALFVASWAHVVWRNARHRVSR